MRGFKKMIAVLCSALLLAQGSIISNLPSSKAQAADSGVNFETMTQNGLNSNSYFWKKAIWNRTTSSYARDVVTRPYPRLVGNQWNILDSGLEDNGDTNKYQQYAAQYFDFIYLNRVKGKYSDKFVDTYDSTHNPNMGLLKYRNGVYAKASTLGRRCYVLPYHAQEGVENYSPPTSGYNYWFHDASDNPWRTSQNISTWDIVNAHNGWYRNSDGGYVQYGSYSTSQRRIFDQRISQMREYWAAHAYHSAEGSGTTQLDGIFADNWLRSNGSDSTGWRKGVNQAAILLKSKWNGDKILVGNGLYSSDYNARDFGMIEDYSGNMRWDFSLSDEFAKANQLTIDSSASTSWGTPWNRLARNLMTDDVFAMHDDENGGVIPFVENYISKLGKVGYPVEDRVNLGNNVYKRAFTHGIAYWNNSGGTATVNVPAGLYKDINGNNVEGTRSLANHAGLILKTRNGGTNPPPTEPPISQAPAAPSELAVTGVSKGATSGNYYVNLTWKDNSNNETGFEILQSVNSTNNFQVTKTPAANGTSYGINLGSTPTPGTYYYKVVAVNASGKSQASNTVTAQIGEVTPPPTQQPPTAPTGLTTMVGKDFTGKDVIILTWQDNSDNEQGFNMYVSNSATGGFTKVATFGPDQTIVAHNVGSVTSGTTFYYQIKAFNAAGESASSNTASGVVR